MVQAQPEGPGLYQTHLGTRVSVREEMHFEYNLELHGSSFLGFLPLAPRTVCSINGDWKDPGFSGYRLPDERDIQGKGFRASWQILNLEGEIPAVYLGADDYYHTRSLELSTGVDLVTPLDIYQTVSRSLKYGFLFILLPFMVLFLMEALTGIRVHVVQYLLVGLSNVVFYLLLLSLAEHIGYLASYIVSALAVTALLLYYLEAVLGGMKKALVYLPLQLLLYLLMYIMLSSVDYALLIGAWGVFVILGVVMVLTRRTDWFGLGSAAGPDKQKSGQSLPVEPGRQS